MILPVLITLAFVQSGITGDWLVVGSHREAVMAVNRTTLSREADTASVTVLMGMFKAEAAQPSPALIQYYLSDETFDCRSSSRIEHEVRVYGVEGEMLGTSLPDHEPQLRPGSIYGDILTMVCTTDLSLAAEGYVTPLDVIRGENAQRHSLGLEIID